VSAFHRHAGLAPHAGVAKHYWILAVIGGALVIALASWAIRRWNGSGHTNPAAEKVRKDFS
jgi:membrane-associated protein